MAIRGDVYLVKLFIVKGADINAKTKKGHTPLLFAEHCGRKDVAELLRKHGAKK